MKNKKIYVILIVLILIGSLFLTYNIYQNKNKVIKTKKRKQNNLAIMIKEDGATDYTKSNSKDIPKGDYVLNRDKSYCKNNGKIGDYDSSLGKVSFSFIGTDSCYLYFDYDSEPKGYEKILLDNGNGATTVNEAKAYIEGRTTSTTPNFSVDATTNEGMYSAKDDLGTSYYYRGAVDNNWVKFGQESSIICTYNDEQVNGGIYNRSAEQIIGTYKISTQSECSGSGVCISRNFGPVIGVSSSECSDDGGTWVNSSPIYGGLKKESIFWRIIRINGDGSIRMIYSGTTAPTSGTAAVMTGEGTQITTGDFNSSSIKAEHVGYQYIEGQQHGFGKCDGANASCTVNGNTVYNSTIKQKIDKWYAGTTLKDNDLIADQIFCNDRSASTSDVTYSNTYYKTLTSWNSTGTQYYYGAYGRLYKSNSPVLTCPTASDKFTVYTSNGNGALTYPVGLITADEVVMAGAGSSSYYLYTNKSYWLGSPYFFDGDYSNAYEFRVDSGGNVDLGVVSNYNIIDVRPVVSLSSKAKLSGSGTYNDVYTVVGHDSTENASSGKSFDTVFAKNNTDIFDEYGLRYEGADPNNYICLDNKTSGACSDSSLLFRIIGLFDEDTSSNGTTSAGTKKLLKILDTNNYGGTSGKYWSGSSSNQSNDWSKSTLNTELNGTYLSTLLATSGINSKLSSAIVNAKWHLGGGSSSNYKTLTAEGIYNEERNTSAIYSGNPSSVYAQVGLMYPSDYGYATVGGSTTSKENCRAQALYNWGSSSYSDCKNNDWVYKSQSISWGSNKNEWLLSPCSSYSFNAARLYSTGYVNLSGDHSVGSNRLEVRPTFYLDSSILKIVGTGDGSSSNPYRIG